MEGPTYVLETIVVLLLGLIVRFSLLLVAIAIAMAIVIPLVYGADGVRRLWSRVALERVAGLRWRGRSYYTPAHQWIRERAGRLRIGLDDVAAHLVGQPNAITAPVAGTLLKRGEPLLTVAAGAERLTLPAPVDGIVKRVNPRILNRPSALTIDPYRNGWIAEMAPSDERYREFLHDDAAKVWFAGEAERLSSALEHVAGIAAADGGELVGPPHAVLDDRQRAALARDFLEIS